MKFEREDKKCTFEIPDRPTVRQQLQYFSAAAGAAGNDMLVRLWYAAVPLMTAWECEAMPDKDINLDEVSNPSQTDVIIWAGLQARTFMNSLEDIPKN